MKKCKKNSMISMLTIALIGTGIALCFTSCKCKKCNKKMKSDLNCDTKNEQ